MNWRAPGLLVAGTILCFSVAIACFKDGTGPALRRKAALVVQPTWANPLSAGAPVTKARVTAKYLDGTVAADQIVTWPTGSDSLILNLDVPMTTGAVSGSQDFVITYRLIGAAGDTLFNGGPVTLTAHATASSGTTATIPGVYVGPGRTAKTLTAIVQDTAVAFGDSITLTALATDTVGSPLPGTLVSWTSLDTNKVKVKDKFGGKLGGKSVRGITQVIAATLTGPADTVNVTVQPVPAILSLVSGNGQTGTTSTVLALPLRVRVKASDSLGVRSIPVTFAVTSGGGSVSSATVFTDSAGFAQVTQTLPATPGTVTVTATVAAVVGSPVTFTQTATPGVPTKLAFTVSPPNTAASTAFGSSVVVQVQDAAGNLVPTATNTVTLSIGTNPGGGTLAGTVSLAAVGGVATFPGLSINKVGAGYTLSAAATGLTPGASGTFNITAGAPAGLLFITNPSSAASLAAISPAVVVAVVDAGGNTVTSATNTIVMTIVGGTGTAGAVLGGTISVAAVGGLATFSTLTIDKAGTGYKLAASTVAVPGTTSTVFNIGPGTPSLLAFQIAPPGTASSLVGFPAVVEIRDASNNVVTTATNTVVLTTSSGPAGGAIGGTVSVAAVAGIATFPTVTLDKVGLYTIRAGATGLGPVFSGTITLDPGPAAALQFASAPSATAAAGAALAVQPNVNVVDTYGNIVTSASGTMTASYTGSGSVTAGATATISGGVASFTGMTVGGLIGSANLSFTDGTRIVTNPFSLTAGAASLVVADSGQAQVAFVSTTLGANIVAKVTDSFGNPVSGVTVSWGVVLGGGLTGAPSSVTDANGRVRTTWTTGGIVGPNGVTGTAAGVGSPASFASYGIPAGTTRTWIGVTSTAWTTATNWSPAVVPGISDNVFIPSATTFAPALSGPVSVVDLTIMAAVPVSLGANVLTVGGNLDGGTAVTATTGGFSMSGSAKTIVGQNLPNLTFTNLTSVVGRTTTLGNVSVTSGNFNVAGRTLVVGGTFTTSSTATLVMTSSTDSLIVNGDATFGGATTSGSLTGGVLRLGGNLVQTSGTSAFSYAPTGTHITAFTGSTAQSATFASPANSGFRNLTVNNPAGVSLATSGTIISGSVIATAGAITGPSATIGIDLTDAGAPSAPNWQVTSLTLTGTGTRLLPSRVASGVVLISNGGTYTPAGKVRFLGGGGVTVTAGGFEVAGFADTIDATFATTGSGLLRMVTSAGDLNVLGAVSFNGGNESGSLTFGTLRVGGNFAQVSGGAGGASSFIASTSHLTVLQGSSPQSVTFASPGTSQFRDLTVNNPAGVSLATSGTIITGSMIATAGVITGPAATIGIDFTDAGAPAAPNWQVTSLTLQGNGTRLIPPRVASTNVTFSSGGTYLPAGKVRFLGAGGVTVSSGGFEVSTASDTIDGPFVTSGGGLLRMVTAGGDLNVLGSATFGGGNESGSLTNGTLRVGGNFTQSSGGAGGTSSFIASTSHMTVLQGASAQTVSFAAAGTSVFRDLTVNNPAGVSLSAGTTITGSVVATAGAITGPSATIGIDLTDAGAVLAIPVPLWQVTSLTLTGNGTRLIPPRVSSTNVTISSGGTYSPSGKVRFLGAGGVTVSAGGFEVTTFSDTIDGPFATTVSGLLRMVTAGGDLNVLGSAAFGGGNESGSLTNGTLRVGGSFTQSSGGSGGTSSFIASTSHLTVLQGASAQTVTFAAAGTSVFRDLTVNNPAGVSLSAGTTITGSVIATAGAITGTSATIGIDLTDAGAVLAIPVPLWQVTSLTLTGNGTRLIPPRVSSTNVTISSGGAYSPAGKVRFVGAGGVTVSAGSFEVTTFSDTIDGPFATTVSGLLRMVTAGGDLNLLGNAAFGGGNESGSLTNGILRVGGSFSQTSGGAGGASSFVASGSQQTILQGSSSQSVSFASRVSSNFQILLITNAAGAVFSGSAAVAGAASVTGVGVNITSGVNDTIFLSSSLTDVSSRWRPSFTALAGGGSPTLPASMFNKVLVTSAVSLANNFTVNGNLVATGNQLTINGRTVRVIGLLKTELAGGRIAMTTTADSIDADSATFAGASTSGNLTNGGLTVRGNFVQTGGVSTQSFAPTINHRTWLVPTAASSVTFANGDTSNSRFRFLTVSAAPNLTIVGGAAVDSTLTLSSGAQVLGGTNARLHVRLAATTAVGTALGTAPSPFKTLAFGSTAAISGTAQTDTVAIYGAGRSLATTFLTAITHTTMRLSTTGGTSSWAAGAALTTNDTLIVDGSGSAFSPSTRTALVLRGLKTRNNGTFNMTSATDSVVVTGAALWAGGASTLTAGSLGVVGPFTQTNASGVNNSFAASGTHRVFRNALSGAPISFTNPGTTATTSHFNRFYANGLGIDTLASSMVVMDTLFVLSSTVQHGIEGLSGQVVTAGTYRDTTALGVFRTTSGPGVGFTLRVRSKFDDRNPSAISLFLVDTVVADTTMGTVVTHQRLPFNVNLKTVVVEGFAKWPGSGAAAAIFTGDLIARNNGSFMVDSNTVTVNGNLITASGGVIRMPSTPAGASASISVLGNATFGGGSTAGLLVKGQISVVGNFTQSGGATDAYQPSSGHITSLNSTSRNISFANPDSAVTSPTGSRFGTLVLNACSGVQTLLSDVAVRDSVFSSPCTGGQISSANKNLIVHGVNFSNFQMVTTQLVWNRVSPSTTTLNAISFSGAFTTNNAFTLNNGTLGLPLIYGSSNLSFASATRTTGAFAVANATVSAFSLTLTGVNPTGPISGKFATGGIATIVWP